VCYWHSIHCVLLAYHILCFTGIPYIVCYLHIIHCVLLAYHTLCVTGIPYIVCYWHNIHCVLLAYHTLCVTGIPYIVCYWHTINCVLLAYHTLLYSCLFSYLNLHGCFMQNYMVSSYWVTDCRSLMFRRSFLVPSSGDYVTPMMVALAVCVM